MRQLTSLLSSLLLFHLTLVGADLTCAKHGAHDYAHTSQPTTSPAAEHHAHHPASPPAAPASDAVSCEVPTVPACCQALASCGVSIAEDRSTERGDLSHLAARAFSGADDAPPSWTLEPVPPPPKA